MAWTHFDLSVLPEDLRRRLPGAIAGAWTALGRRYVVDDGELRVNWGAPVHHTAIPAVVALDAILDPAAAARFHAGVRLARVFDRVPAMDGAQRRLLAAIGGVDLEDVSSAGLTRRFNGHLFALLERPGLAPFFAVRSPCLDRYDVHPVEPLTLARRARALTPSTGCCWLRSAASTTATSRRMPSGGGGTRPRWMPASGSMRCGTGIPESSQIGTDCSRRIRAGGRGFPACEVVPREDDLPDLGPIGAHPSVLLR